MRELKFRVWNEKVKEFNYWGFNVNDTKGFAGVSVSNTLSLDDAHKLSEQFTGLTDKNGVDIYKGDILEYTESTCSHPDFTKHAKKTKEVTTKVMCELALASCYRSDTDFYEVIGNIHK